MRHIPAIIASCLLLVLASVPSANAQVTTGTIAGRIVDEQGSPVPGAVVTVTDATTGLSRNATSSNGGLYRLPALPVGRYEVRAELSGFRPFERLDTQVNLATTLSLDITLAVATVTETVQVTAAAPLISTRSSSVGEVVDLTRIESLPLNGRQFANLAATVAGVGLDYHSDVSKNAQFVPQIGGGNGRNVNYVVDGGDNNDDTVGGLLQGFPLEAIQEFNLVTQRFDAEHGRSNGAVLNVVTKNGTNTLRGSWFTLARDEALNARTFSERRGSIDKQEYGRAQFGGSVGGPIRLDRLHYFGAYERTSQRTMQVVDTRGVYPGDGVFPADFRQHLGTAKLTAQPAPAHYLSLRYGGDRNVQPTAARPTTAFESWGVSTNTFNSVNGNHNWLLGNSSLNELVVQYSGYRNDITSDGIGRPSIMTFTNVLGGANILAPSVTEQTKWQVRDDYSWTLGGLGIGHELRAGVNWLHEPRLFIHTGQGVNGIYVLATPNVNGPVFQVQQTGGLLEANFPLDFYGLYVQDDWRATDRITFNLGVRWDYVAGAALNQERSSNFQKLQAAGQQGLLTGTLFEDFGKPTRSDRDNIQPRAGVAIDLRGDGRDVVRAGWGLYTDFSYINANTLLAAFDARGGGGLILATPGEAAGLRKADGTLFQVTDSIETIRYLNTLDPSLPPSSGEVASPLLEQPYTRQYNVGWSHAFGDHTALDVDVVRAEGRDLNMRVRPNTLIDGRRLLADLQVQPPSFNFRVAVSKGTSLYEALIVGLRRRLSQGVDVNASYTLARATSDIGTAYDEIAQNLIQDVTDAFSTVQQAPSGRTDARHRITASAIVEAPFGIRVASVFSFRSALPMHTSEGIDLNGDRNGNDKTALAYRYTGFDAGIATYREDGVCETVNCSRRAPFSQMNLRISRSFPLPGNARVEAIAEVFNLFNAINPSLPPTSARLASNGAPAADFMQPTAFAGDIGQMEQRVGQIGFRITF